MKIIFFGTPSYVLPVVRALNKTFRTKEEGSPIEAVVTQKPKPTGRRQELTYSPVDDWAHERKIPIFFEPEKIGHIKADIGVLAAFGKIIPKSTIKHFPNGILNIHPSLLPKYRGASPVQAAILSGETTTGVTIISLDEKLDHGEIVSRFKEDIKNEDTTESLRKRLFERSGPFLAALIPPYISKKVRSKKQDEKEAIFTKTLTKDDGFINPSYFKASLTGKSLNQIWKIDFIEDFSLKPSPETLDRFIRAMYPWPVAWTHVSLNKGAKRRIKIIKATLSGGKLVPETIQIEGKTETTWEEFSRGYTFEF